MPSPPRYIPVVANKILPTPAYQMPPPPYAYAEPKVSVTRIDPSAPDTVGYAVEMGFIDGSIAPIPDDMTQMPGYAIATGTVTVGSYKTHRWKREMPVGMPDPYIAYRVTLLTPANEKAESRVEVT